MANVKFGYTVENDGRLLNAPCGCEACDSERQPGHRYCDAPTQNLLDAEESGVIVRQLDHSGWHWYADKK